MRIILCLLACIMIVLGGCTQASQPAANDSAMETPEMQNDTMDSAMQNDSMDAHANESMPAGGPEPEDANESVTEAGNMSANTSVSEEPEAQLILTMEEVSKHNSATDCWMVIYGSVLNLTAFSSHPGGSAYVPFCGTEASQAFDTKGGGGNSHSSSATAGLDFYTIGQLGEPQNRTVNGSNVSIPGGDDDDEWEDEYEDDEHEWEDDD